MRVNNRIRWGWLKFMYIYTIVGAGALGAGILIAPTFIKSVFNWPFSEPISVGIVASVYIAFGILSILGIRSPLKYSPILFLQLCYKSVWFIGVILPRAVTGQFPGYAIVFVIIFASYIIGDLIALPFSYFFAKSVEKIS